MTRRVVLFVLVVALIALACQAGVLIAIELWRRSYL